MWSTFSFLLVQSNACSLAWISSISHAPHNLITSSWTPPYLRYQSRFCCASGQLVVPPCPAARQQQWRAWPLGASGSKYRLCWFSQKMMGRWFDSFFKERSHQPDLDVPGGDLHTTRRLFILHLCFYSMFPNIGFRVRVEVLVPYKRKPCYL